MNLTGFLDYNSTSPLSDSVRNYLRGDDYFYNPSAPYFASKKSLGDIKRTEAFLLESFGLSPSEFDVAFHAGSTEAINIFLKGFLLENMKAQKFYFSETDHACALKQKPFIEHFEREFVFMDLLPNTGVVKDLPGDADFIHLTSISNESGQVNPLSLLDKAPQNALVYIDATQSIGKHKDGMKLHPRGDIYSFSGHKFGALKGVGWSFVKKNLPITKIIAGGDQAPWRSGTFNIMGINSIFHALSDWQENLCIIQECKVFRDNIELKLKEDFPQIKILNSASFGERGVNTLLVAHPKVKADILIGAFDLEGIQVSSGSACSSGSQKGNNWVNIVFGKELALRTIRLSFNPWVHRGDIEPLYKKISNVFSRF